MTMREVADELGFEIVQDEFDDRAVGHAYTSDLLSDVMANADDADLLVTIQAHKNTVAVATLNDIGGVIICNDREVPADMVAAAAKERIALFRTRWNQFRVSGEVFRRLQDA